MSESAIDKLGETETEVKIHTHYHVREDEISLYGFITNEELRMFELLILVSGIGAKSAIVILSNISPSKFALAVIANDTGTLTKVPGIGAKTAARIILELKDRMKTEEIVKENIDESIDTNKADEMSQIKEEAILALKVLGYYKTEIDKALEKIDSNQLTIEEIIKKALLYLGR